MKWLISLVALYGAIVTAFPSNIKAIDFPDVEDAAGIGLADIQKEGGDMPKRGICTTKSKSCCCQCAESAAWPCIGCRGLKICEKLGAVPFESKTMEDFELWDRR